MNFPELEEALTSANEKIANLQKEVKIIGRAYIEIMEIMRPIIIQHHSQHKVQQEVWGDGDPDPSRRFRRIEDFLL